MQSTIGHTSITLSDLAEVMPLDAPIENIDGGDHMINMWSGEEGERFISIQGTGESITLLKLAA